MLNYLKTFLLCNVSLGSAIITCGTMISFTKFISHINYNNITLNHTTDYNDDYWYELHKPGLINLSLILVFLIQHSVLNPVFKKVMTLLQLQVLERSIFNIFSSVTLLILMRFWISTGNHSIWEINVYDNNLLWMLFTGIQVLGWVIIYIDSLVMDVSCKLGIKQVYYHLTGRPDPYSQKTHELNELTSKIPHSLVGFLMVLWIYPHMRYQIARNYKLITYV
uniref:Nuclear envelope membrane protein n=1 Tax=Clastoptera arizonana TaxID=38151 RepID=A0A1B6E0L3_9HEMI